MSAALDARRRFLSPPDFHRLALELARDPAIADLVQGLYRLGLRPSEARALTLHDAIFDEDAVRLRLPPQIGEGAPRRTVRLPEELADLFRRRLASGEGPQVFLRAGRPIGDFSRTWRRATLAIGRGGLIVHDLRGSFLRNALAAGVPLPVAGALIGLSTHRLPLRGPRGPDEDTLTDALARVNALISGARP